MPLKMDGKERVNWWKKNPYSISSLPWTKKCSFGIHQFRWWNTKQLLMYCVRSEQREMIPLWPQRTELKNSAGSHEVSLFPLVGQPLLWDKVRRRPLYAINLFESHWSLDASSLAWFCRRHRRRRRRLSPWDKMSEEKWDPLLTRYTCIRRMWLVWWAASVVRALVGLVVPVSFPFVRLAQNIITQCRQSLKCWHIWRDWYEVSCESWERLTVAHRVVRWERRGWILRCFCDDGLDCGHGWIYRYAFCLDTCVEFVFFRCPNLDVVFR